MNQMLIRVIFAFLGLLAVPLVGAQAPQGGASRPATAPELIGEWRSAGPEGVGSFFGRRTFVFTESAWALRFEASADDSFRQPLFTLRIEGTYMVGASSATVHGASEAVFLYVRRYLTATSAAGADLFRAQGCSLEVGVEQDISVQGCGFIHSIQVSGIEYDLLALQDGRLRLGDRSGNLAVQRPSLLSAHALVRR